jgi:transketolase N-terminal domain/subunit
MITRKMNQIERRIIDLSYKHKLSHLGSCLTAVNHIKAIYDVKEPDEPFVLGNAHAGLALYTVLESKGLGDAEEMVTRMGTHSERDKNIWVSGGSLGQAETVAVGMALADRRKNVYLMTSDGACAEGSVWEALRIAAEQRLENLRVVVIANGYGANGRIDLDYLETRLKSFYPVLFQRVNLYEWPDWLQGLSGHYVVMNEMQYREVTNER